MNRTGFGLIQTLIALGLVSMLVLYTSSMIENGNRSVASMNNLMRIEDYVRANFYYLGKKQFCESTALIGHLINPDGSNNTFPSINNTHGQEIFPSAPTSHIGWVFSTQIENIVPYSGDPPCTSASPHCNYIANVKITATPSPGTLSHIPVKIYDKDVYLETTGEDPNIPRPITSCSFDSPSLNAAQIKPFPVRVYFTQIDLGGSFEFCKYYLGNPNNSAVRYYPPVTDKLIHGGSHIDLGECHSLTKADLLANLVQVASDMNNALPSYQIVGAFPSSFHVLPNSPMASLSVTDPNDWNDLMWNLNLVVTE